MRTLKPTITLGLTLLAGGLISHSLPAGEVAAPSPATADAGVGEVHDSLQPGIASDAVRRYARAATLASQGDHELAAQQLLRISIDYPSYYNALVLLGKNLDFDRQRQLAIDTLEQALKVQQDEKIPDSEAAYVLGNMYMEAEKDQKALETFQKGLTVEATNSREMNGKLYNAAAACYSILGDEPKSLENHKIAAEKYGNEVSIRRLAVLAEKHEIDTTINRADRAIKPGLRTGYDITTTLPLPPPIPEDAKAPELVNPEVPGPIVADAKPKKDPRPTAEKYIPFEEAPAKGETSPMPKEKP